MVKRTFSPFTRCTGGLNFLELVFFGPEGVVKQADKCVIIETLTRKEVRFISNQLNVSLGRLVCLGVIGTACVI